MSPEEAAYNVMLEVSQTLSECGEFVVIGGWVPELHFPQKGHAGSIDVDVVLPPSLQHLAIQMAPLLETESGCEAYELLRQQFADHDSVGPRKVAEFAREIGQNPEQLQQAAYQDAQELFRCVSLARGDL